ncbi:MAG: hypothetical protein NZ555_05605 [Geminicoccaceae bacterium]|nr:hypothetical protein [Geminicoccaceae bacterium]MCX8102424.1 hypothetical protein [Geminicoccaceae bacterium]MDW8370814.1 hypothetical protein [Geminicoccaceae bacterium]
MSRTADQAARCRRIVHKALALVRPVFALELDGIHGVPHWSRVCRHGRFLAGELGLDPALTTWFAFLHDSRRRDDGHDPGHGRRGADFALRLWRAGSIEELDRRGFELLAEAIRWHSGGRTEGEPALLACWDADRLDLARLGIRPDPRKLATAPARRPEVIEAVVLRARRARDRQRHSARWW